jgi:hypothetical protein
MFKVSNLDETIASFVVFFLIVYMQMPQNIFGERLKVSSFDAKNFLLLVSYC